MKEQPSSTSKRRRSNEAEIRLNPQTGYEFIYVERPEVVSCGDMTEADAVAFKNPRPTGEELRSDQWSDE